LVQNLEPGTFAVPHCGQVIVAVATCWPQFGQNLEPGGTGWPQFEQGVPCGAAWDDG
jgi:hypothetical protein